MIARCDLRGENISVETMANMYVQAIQKKFPEGPYIIGGHSMGGVIALEMAHIFKVNGVKIDRLIVIDSAFGPKIPDFLLSKEGVLRFLVESISSQALDVHSFNNLTYDDQIKYFIRLRTPEDCVDILQKVEPIKQYIEIFKKHMHMLKAYTPKNTDQNILFFKAREKWVFSNDNFEDDWNSISENAINLVTIPGNHIT